MSFNQFVVIGLVLMLAVSAGAVESGVVVDGIEPGGAAETAGLLVGDVLLAWERAGGETGSFRSPFDLQDVEIEQAALGRVTILYDRAESHLRAELPPGEWKVHTRPRFTGDSLAAYRRAEQLVETGDVQEAVAGIRRLVDRTGQVEQRVWLLNRAAVWVGVTGNWADSETIFNDAARLAESGDVGLLADLRESEGDLYRRNGRYEGAALAFREALAERQRLSTDSLRMAACWNALGELALRSGDHQSALESFRRTLEIQERLALI